MAQNKHNFAAPFPDVTSSYAGELALPYIHALVLSAPTMAGGNVTVIEGIKFKAQLPTMATGSLIQAGACDFDDATTTTNLDNKALEVTDLMVNLQLCKKEFRTWWQGSPYTINNSVPNDMADALLLYVAGQVQAEMEKNIWVGNETGSGVTLFNGLVKQFSANGGTVTTLAKSLKVKADVIEGLGEVIAEMPTELVGDYENVKIFVNPATIDLYNIAIGELGGGYNNATSNNGIMKFSGYDLVSAPGLTFGYVVVARPQDLAVGVGSADSVELAQAIDMTPLDGSDNYRVTMRFAVGTQVARHQNIDVQKSA